MREAIRLEPDNGQAHQGLARAFWVGKGDFADAIPEFERAIELNPEAGYSYLQLSLLLAWEGKYARAEEISRRAVDLQEQYMSGNAGLQIVGAHGRLGYVYYLQGRYDDALQEYERELAFINSSDHALRERTNIELGVQSRRRLSPRRGAPRMRPGTSSARSRRSTHASRVAPTIRRRGTTSPSFMPCAATPTVRSIRCSASRRCSRH